MRESLRIAGAYIGVVVGAGFASGQEVLQFFTSFGWYGFLGIFIAMVLFTFLGAQILQIGAQLQLTSHQHFFTHVYGKRVGRVVDYVILFCLFGVTTVMVAGSGALFEQQFGINPSWGSLIFTIMVAITVCLKIRDVILVISSVTPFLIVLVIMLTVYSFFDANLNSSQLAQALEGYRPIVSNWSFAALLYVTFNIALAVAILAIIGGTAKNIRVARWGGLLGGAGLGFLLLFIHVSIFLNIDQLQGVAMPTVFLATKLSPFIGFFMALTLLAMVFNTAVGAVYAFTSRFFEAETGSFYMLALFISSLAFLISLFGFTELMTTIYPITGIIGLLLILALFIGYIQRHLVKHHR